MHTVITDPPFTVSVWQVTDPTICDHDGPYGDLWVSPYHNPMSNFLCSEGGKGLRSAFLGLFMKSAQIFIHRN